METNSTFHEIYGYYYTPLYQEPWFIILASLVVLGGIVLICYAIYKRKLKNPTPWEWALKEINKLQLITYSSKNDYKKFYFSITTILKTYLEKRFSWDTQDKTDDELATFLQLHGFNNELLERLKKMLQGAAWIKFANEEAIKTQVDDDFKTAELIIKKTIPVKKENLRPG